MILRGGSVVVSDLLEQLAELEHEQWEAWSKSLARSEHLSKERIERWEKLWVPYELLPFAEQEKDRSWAKEVLKIVDSKICEREIINQDYRQEIFQAKDEVITKLRGALEEIDATLGCFEKLGRTGIDRVQLNEPYIDCLEAENRRLCSRVNYLVDHKNDIKSEKEELEARIENLLEQIADLSDDVNKRVARIAELEGDSYLLIDVEETITKLREALEFYANDTSYRSKHGGHIENRNFHSKIGQDCGQKARTALKECFGEENE